MLSSIFSGINSQRVWINFVFKMEIFYGFFFTSMGKVSYENISYIYALSTWFVILFNSKRKHVRCATEQ